MKKKILLTTILGLMIGGAVAFSTTKPMEMVKAEGEESTEIIEEVSEDPVEEEIVEEKTLEDYVRELEEKLAKVKNYQVLGTTVGAIVGGIVSLLMSLGFSLVNKQNINKSCKITQVNEMQLVDIKATNKKLEDNYTTVTNKLSMVSEQLSKVEEVNKNVMATLDNQKAIIDNQNQEIAYLVSIIASCPDMVKNGVAEQVCKNFGNTDK